MTGFLTRLLVRSFQPAQAVLQPRLNPIFAPPEKISDPEFLGDSRSRVDPASALAQARENVFQPAASQHEILDKSPETKSPEAIRPPARPLAVSFQETSVFTRAPQGRSELPTPESPEPNDSTENASREIARQSRADGSDDRARNVAGRVEDRIGPANDQQSLVLPREREEPQPATAPPAHVPIMARRDFIDTAFNDTAHSIAEAGIPPDRTARVAGREKPARPTVGTRVRVADRASVPESQPAVVPRSRRLEESNSNKGHVFPTPVFGNRSLPTARKLPGETRRASADPINGRETTIEVTIGRIEVRGVPPAEIRRTTAQTPRQSTLDAYLKRRSRRSRE